MEVPHAEEVMRSMEEPISLKLPKPLCSPVPGGCIVYRPSAAIARRCGPASAPQHHGPGISGKDVLALPPADLGASSVARYANHGPARNCAP
jgi:hypothetical protein